MSAAYDVRRWDWEREPDAPRTWPEADRRLVVCEPSFCEACAGSGVEASAKSCSWCQACAGISRLSVEAYNHVVVGGDINEIYVSDYREFVAWPSWMIPALLVRTQADLDGRRCEACGGALIMAVATHAPRVPPEACQVCEDWGTLGGVRALLAVQAERRALVCSPREALLLPFLTPFSSAAARDAAMAARAGIDLLVIMGEVGLDARPMHPEHVRSLVEQGRAAGVPVVFAGWGETMPWSQRAADSQIDAGALSRPFGDELFYRVGADRAGALLDGAEVRDPLPWLGGAA